MPHKLSEAQRRVLQKMASGRLLIRIEDGAKPYTYLNVSRLQDPHGIQPRTFDRLLEGGFIRLWEGSRLVTKYTLTEAGREALQQSGGIDNQE